MKEAELLKKLREAFGVEAQERLASLSASLLSLEKAPSDRERSRDLEVAFREAHSLKGAARSVNLAEIEGICQAIEGVFAAMKRDEIPASGDLFDLLHHCVKAIEDFLAAPEAVRPERMEEISTLVSRLREVQAARPMKSPGTIPGERGVSTREKPVPAEEAVETPKKADSGGERVPAKGVAQGLPLSDQSRPGTARKPPVSESIRVSTAKLEALFVKVQELISLKLTSNQHLSDLKAILRSIEGWNKRWAKMETERRAFQKMGGNGDAMDRLARFLEWNCDVIRSLEGGLRTLIKASEQNGRVLGLMVDDLLTDMKQVTMLPFSTLLDIFPRMVREISRDQGKEVELVVKGAEVEIDRRILEEMRDPVTHILRNAVDHGIEFPQKRKGQGKPRAGTIAVTVSQTEGGKVEVLISDDGAGIDLAQVREKAQGMGIITEEEMEALSERDALSLVIQSGVSTSPIITDISGRGLGLAIVAEKVEGLGGLLSIDSALGKGTSFKIVLPVTISTFRGILIQVADRSFIVPSANMERALRVHKDQVQTVENRATIPLDGKALALVDLAGVLGLQQPKSPSNNTPYVSVAVLGKGDQRVGFRVDEVAGEQEVLVKGLGKQLRHVPCISGATILGSGKVVPILNVNELLPTALKTPVRDRGKQGSEEQTEKPLILVAEDSITSRTLIKNILEGAGYRVQTAVDGAEAFATLRTGQFDLVVSDVEMPRMDGFELTRRIRKETKYADLPVVLVTGLETREDREKGIDAGADAYIVKSSFDQSNLIEVIRRMI